MKEVSLPELQPGDDIVVGHFRGTGSGRLDRSSFVATLRYSMSLSHSIHKSLSLQPHQLNIVCTQQNPQRSPSCTRRQIRPSPPP